MFNYTYFIISPGAQIGSTVQYRDVCGNYIKFGDSHNAHEDHGGIRGAYLTHNPDIGIMALMDSQAFQGPGLGTRLKNYIFELGYDPVGATEWFAIEEAAAWSVARAMLPWDRKTVTPVNLAQITDMLHEILGDPAVRAASIGIAAEARELAKAAVLPVVN